MPDTCWFVERKEMPDTCWFVESRPNDRFEGWWAGPPKGEGGWLTTDPLKAKRYSEAEARAVAEALSYFPTPFGWSNWIATEHRFVAAEPELHGVLSSLINEAEGFLAMADRGVHGDTNIQCMARRIAEARAALAKARGRLPPE